MSDSWGTPRVIPIQSSIFWYQNKSQSYISDNLPSPILVLKAFFTSPSKTIAQDLLLLFISLKTFFIASTRAFFYSLRKHCSLRQAFITLNMISGHTISASFSLPAIMLSNRPVTLEPCQSISLDFIGLSPGSKHGNNHILVVMDYFSKYVVLFPGRYSASKTLIKQLEQYIFLVY